MKCHKYFQHKKFPFFAVKDVEYDNFMKLWVVTPLDDHFPEGFVKIEKLQILWITESLKMAKLPVSRIISKTAVFDMKDLWLLEQNLLFDEFKLLTASGNVKFLRLDETKIKYENGDSVFIDELFEFLPNIEHITVFSHGPNLFSSNFASTFEKIDASKLKLVDLELSSFNDFEKFSKFMDQNPHVEYSIDFVHCKFSSEERLAFHNYVQRIIDAGLTEFPPPKIEFNGHINTQWEALRSLIRQYNDKHFLNP
uniref:DUF38 domain-containing protein n=1 Tax=Panagrolaimus sp. ES5 TaxID=591445 RepID=A0AC34GYR4_9BILA